MENINTVMNTDIINTNNFDSVRAQILSKKKASPFYATKSMAKSVITDQDSFPYKRYFRGEYKSVRPIIMEREAGFRPRDDACYSQSCVGAKLQDLTCNPYPRNCFEAPCSTVYPCYPDTLRRYADKAEMEVMLNNECITLTR